jgi:alpha-tubulin suppressor-like RCC1 family protein
MDKKHDTSRRHFQAYASPAYVLAALARLPRDIWALICPIYRSLCEVFAACAGHVVIVATYCEIYHCTNIGGVLHNLLPLSDRRNTPERNHSIGRVIAVSAGKQHTIISTTNGLFGYGSNLYGQLGLPREVSRMNTGIRRVHGFAESVSCGTMHTVILVGGDVFGCGSNECGQLGRHCTYAYVYGFTRMTVGNAVAISCGDRFTAVLMVDNVIWIYGNLDPRFPHIGPEKFTGTAIYADRTFVHFKNENAWNRARPLDGQWLVNRRDLTWNTPHGAYVGPDETLRALQKEKSDLGYIQRHNTLPVDLGVITMVYCADNAVIAGNGGVFVCLNIDRAGSEWVRL